MDAAVHEEARAARSEGNRYRIGHGQAKGASAEVERWFVG